jgi:hypothetical protein
MDFGKLLARVQAILLTPRSAWPQIATEAATVQGLYTGYIAWLAAIPVLCGLLAWNSASLNALVIAYLASLVAAYIVAILIDSLAPSFGGQRDATQAMKLVAYSSTASWIAGVGALIPLVGWIVELAGSAYSVYLLYLGLPVLMRCPPERTLMYTIVIVVLTLVLFGVLGAVLGGGAVLGLGTLR